MKNLKGSGGDTLAPTVTLIAWPSLRTGSGTRRLDYWAGRVSDLALLRGHAPLNPDWQIYHENAFDPREVATILFNLGLPVRSIRPKHVFD